MNNRLLIERDRAYGARRLAEAEADPDEAFEARVRGARWLAVVLAVSAILTLSGLLWLCKVIQP